MNETYKNILRTDTTIRMADRLGSWRARWGLGRMSYTVQPGLYALGRPDRDSEVFITANYKMSFDRLRAQLVDRKAWILVLDTKGINVWCAAGKGTFGTDEIINRVESANLSEIVSHKRLIVPQLGAPGVNSHEVRKKTGFRITYGPVRAKDLPKFLNDGMKATPEMRLVKFPFLDRIVLIPIEFVMSAKYLLLLAIALFLLAGIGHGGYSSARAVAAFPRNTIFLLGAYFAGTVLTPALLPCLPGRAFSVKGLWAGIFLMVVAGMCMTGRPPVFDSAFSAVAWLMLAPAISSFLAMNFTGASTYTSLSGVRKEMGVAVPLQAVGLLAGLTLWVVGRFV
jgi:hypothetical protein